jgi:hypothetical protein
MKFKSKIFFVILLLFNTLYSQTTVKLELEGVENIRDERIKKNVPTAYIGEQFTVKAIVSSGSRDTGEVDVEGLDDLNVIGKSRSTNISMINSSFTAENTYMFTVLPNQEGDFEIGPATVKQNNQIIKSVPEKINFKVTQRKEGTVAQSRMVSTDRGNATGEYELFCKLKSEKEAVYIGQPFVLSVSIYNRGNISQAGLEPPKFPGFLAKEISQVEHKQEVVEGKNFSVLEKKYVLLPEEAGEKTINPVAVSFNVPVQRRGRGGFFDDDDFFGGFFGRRGEQKRVVSNSLQIKVKKLPSHKGVVDGVGEFTSFKATVDKEKAVINEPILLSLEVEGKGNLDQIVTPELNLPDKFNVYESKTDLQQDLAMGYFGGKKRFEFVVQVGVAGKCKIPEQKFVYFDVNSKAYKALKTEAIELNIKLPPEGQYSASPAPLVKDKDKQEKEIEKLSYKEDIHFIEEEAANLSKQESRKFSFWIFFILLLLPFLFYFKKVFDPVTYWLKENLFGWYLKKQSLTKFKKELDTIVKNNETNKLHQFFVSYLAAKFGVDTTDITEDWIEYKLFEFGWKHEKITDFLNYLSECASLSFASGIKVDINKNKLLEKSIYWFFLLGSGVVK